MSPFNLKYSANFGDVLRLKLVPFLSRVFATSPLSTSSFMWSYAEDPGSSINAVCLRGSFNAITDQVLNTAGFKSTGHNNSTKSM